VPRAFACALIQQGMMTLTPEHCATWSFLSVIEPTPLAELHQPSWFSERRML
jgi:hypothetical protein